jgi:hypothetical protein
MLTALCSLALFAMLRVSEYSASHVDGRRALKWSQLRFLLDSNGEPSRLVGTLGDRSSDDRRETKTSHFKPQLEQLVVTCTCSCGLCAVHSMWRWLKLAGPCDESTPVFLWSTGRAVTEHDVGLLITAICRSAGLDRSEYRPHCFRMRGATLLFEWGLPVELIRLLGRWAPSSLTLELHYVRPRQQAAASLLSLFVPAGNGAPAAPAGLTSALSSVLSSSSFGGRSAE